MMRTFRSGLTLAALILGCGAEPDPGSSGGGDEIKPLEIDVPSTGRVFVELTTPAVVEVPGDPLTSTAWDMAFEGYDVFTNSGVSGPGESGALGPYAPAIFDSGIDPGAPILTRDAIGGPFHLWYGYDYTNPAHVLYSRFHVFGVKDGDRLWKVQVLSYYGEVEGAPVSALYRIRYAELMPGARFRRRKSRISTGRRAARSARRRARASAWISGRARGSCYRRPRRWYRPRGTCVSGAR
ncbi:MAG: HmuY family protein [Polyangiaceae bacterium]|nr:HmuY family protein [Polyangiaceae bacterium]